MTVPANYIDHFVEIKYMLTSYRAVVDGRLGVAKLKELSRRPSFPIYEWKIIWVGTCSILRASMDALRKVDSKSCLPEKLRAQFINEWNEIGGNRNEHSIFWDFLHKERNNILHQYQWPAYEVWLKPDGSSGHAPTILGGNCHEVSAFFLMRNGKFKGQDSIQLLETAASWAEDRIFRAISNAGFDPSEKRNVVDFRPISNEDIARIAPATALLMGLNLGSNNKAAK